MIKTIVGLWVQYDLTIWIPAVLVILVLIFLGEKLDILSGLFNRYSIVLLATMWYLLYFGGKYIYEGHHLFRGILMFVLGMTMLRGLKELRPADGRESGLITVFSRRTNTVVSGIVLTLDWLPLEIVGVAPFDMRTVDHDFKIPSIACSDDIRVGGTVSASIKPSPSGLGSYDDNGRMEGIIKQLDDLLVTWLQEIAASQIDQNGRKIQGTGKTSDFMEFQSLDVACMLLERLMNVGQQNSTYIQLPRGTTPSSFSACIEGWGIIIVNLQVKLQPLNPEVIRGRESRQLREIEREGRLRDAAVMNEATRLRYTERLEEWQRQGRQGPQPTLESCRMEILTEELSRAGKVTATLNQGAPTLNINRQP